MTNRSETPQLSVIIPSYNHAKHVTAAIRSALDQDIAGLEVIVVDDASTDDSVGAIRSVVDQRLKLIVMPSNKGMSEALNLGLAESRSDLIAIIGSDDYYLPGVLSNQMNFLRTHADISAVFGMPRLVDGSGRPLGAGYAEFTFPFKRVPQRGDWIRHFFMEGNFLCHPTVVMRRAVHTEIGTYDRRLLNLSDFDLWVRMAVAGLNIAVRPIEIVGRRVFHDGSNLSAPSPQSSRRAAFEHIRVLRHFLGLSREDVVAAFAEDIARLAVEADGSVAQTLARLAATSPHQHMQYFALETLYDALASNPEHSARELFLLAGMLNPLNIVPPEPPPIAPPSRPPAAAPTGAARKIGRNDPCPCGSGKKYKNCHAA